jgi:hypothetical protein
VPCPCPRPSATARKTNESREGRVAANRHANYENLPRMENGTTAVMRITHLMRGPYPPEIPKQQDVSAAPHNASHDAAYYWRILALLSFHTICLCTSQENIVKHWREWECVLSLAGRSNTPQLKVIEPKVLPYSMILP